MTRPRPAGDEQLQDIQVMLRSDASPSSIRILKVGLLSGPVRVAWLMYGAQGSGIGSLWHQMWCDPEQDTLSKPVSLCVKYFSRLMF